ncbi:MULTISPECIES: hypothetical protein [unclassified Rhodococcus (in: high G+C Gram-positive bacteria)]|uniref:hypothetical protein n=1 Tax=unclassified Rhodococcus (in: high G+C Gram-positive bacteria) TaxID=192944 RepID=UPI001C3DCEE9|nr:MULTISPECIES: hypothetical protein [unclassified Rhodococcus (in: high G+C Gram-positive bacteria)]
MTDRHPGTQHLLGLFEYAHLPAHLQEISIPLRATALDMTEVLQDGPELTTGLRKLLEAKDCFVRQAVIDHRTTTAPTPEPAPNLATTECAAFKPMIHDDPNICFDCGLTRDAHEGVFTL